MTTPTAPDLAGAAAAVELAQHLVDQACASVRESGGIDANQVVAYDVAHAAAAVATARATLEYGAQGEVEARIAAAFVADVVADLVGRVAGREALWGVEPGWDAPAAAFLRQQRDPAVLAGLATTEGPRHLGEDFELVRETFHRFAEDKVRPHAEQVHRENLDIPEEVDRGPGRAGRLRAVGARGVRRLRHRRRERLHGHGRRHRGAQLGLAGRRRLAHHPSRDPDPGAGLRRHRGAEEAVATEAGLGRDVWPPSP